MELQFVRNMIVLWLCIFLLSPGQIISNSLVGCDPYDVILPVACGASSLDSIPFTGIPDHVVFTHTLEKSCYGLIECCDIVRSLQSYHVDVLDWSNIGFNFLIGNDGRVYVGRGWNQVGQFSTHYNEKSLSVAFIGNYYEKPPERKALSTVKSLLKCAVFKKRLAMNYTLHMHEDLECSSNPAPGLKQEITTWLHYEGKAADYLRC
ncbi:peptidoglycan recognition protein-like [Stegodyphus dumicola]|uniref:peptidoglycan recognition protein-like n=1 Tax=Stegodyphus dumicola TaxID=202533 RepID=UPI0015ACF638|nr:peptidoglycan recognition protein-like [Stegodyphus dumicola]